MNILWNLWYLQYITISYKTIKKLMSMYTVHEDGPIQNREMFCTLHSFINLYISYFLKILLCSNLIYCVELWQIHKYNRKNNSSLKFILCTRLKRNLSLKFKLKFISHTWQTLVLTGISFLLFHKIFHLFITTKCEWQNKNLFGCP